MVMPLLGDDGEAPLGRLTGLYFWRSRSCFKSMRVDSLNWMRRAWKTELFLRKRLASTCCMSVIIVAVCVLLVKGACNWDKVRLLEARNAKKKEKNSK